MAQSTAVRLPTAEDWRRQILDDIELQALDAGVTIPPVAKGSDFDLKATALGNALAVLTANQVLSDADADPTRASGAALEELRVASGLPEVLPTPASGRVSVTVTSAAPITVPDGHGILAPGALPARTVGAVTGVITGAQLPFAMTKEGSVGNLKAGTVVRFTAPVAGLASEAVVVADMVDGADAETDVKKRRRILNRRQNSPACANWGHLREVAMSASNAVDNAVVYPALGGPASCKTVLTAPWFNGGTGQSRVASAASVALVQSDFRDTFNTDDAYYRVESAANEYVDLYLRVKLLPGAGDWIDADPWPRVDMRVGAVTSDTVFRITSSEATTAPPVGRTIAVWSIASLGFRTATVLAATTISPTEFAVTTSGWTGGVVSLVSGLPIGCAAPNLSAWGDRILEAFAELTPGEGCYTWQEPRSLRMPVESLAEPMSFGSRQLAAFADSFDEIASVEIASANLTTPTRVTPGVAPNVLTLRRLSFGRLT